VPIVTLVVQGGKPELPPADSTAMADRRLEMAYDAAKDSLKRQDATFTNIRTRSNGLLTVAALVTSFAAGLGLMNTDQNKGAVVPAAGAWALLGILAVIGALVMFVLWPVQWHFGPGAAEIYSRRKAGEAEDAIREFIVEKMLDGITDNNAALLRRGHAYRLSVMLLFIEVVVLVIVLIRVG